MRSNAGFFLILVWIFSVPAQADRTNPPGKLIDIGGRSLHLNCTGEGAPTVVLDAGLGGNSLEWAAVQAQVSHFTRVCSYDRAGYGWSDPGPGPRNSSVIVEDLHAGLALAPVPGPYVLVGHSFGGFNVRLFAARYPSESAGLVLVDAAHEAQFERLARGPAPSHIVPRGQFIALPTLGIPEGLPTELNTLALRLAVAPKARRAALSELRQFENSAAQVRSERSDQNLPLVVVSRSAHLWNDSPQAQQLERTWAQLQWDLKKLSSRGIQVFSSSQRHHVHLAEPELVVEAIRAVVMATQTQM